MAVEEQKKKAEKKTSVEEPEDEDIDVDHLLSVLEKERKEKSIPDEIYEEMKERLESNR